MRGQRRGADPPHPPQAVLAEVGMRTPPQLGPVMPRAVKQPQRNEKAGGDTSAYRSGGDRRGGGSCAGRGGAGGGARGEDRTSWEVSSSGGPGGGGGPGRPMPQIPADALAKLTPAQQAMVQAQMAAAAGGGAAKPIVRKMCVTQAMLEKGFAGPDDRHNCARTLVSSSASAMEFKMACTGDHPATGSFKLQAADAQTVNGTVDLTITDKSGASFPIHRTTQGKWLADDCGDVKPPQ